MNKTANDMDDDAVMSLPKCASYLHLSEKTVLQLATGHQLPAELVGKNWQFRRSLVDEWLQQRLSIEADDGIEEIPDGMRVPLGDMMPKDAILGDLKATDAISVIEELAAHAYNQKWLKNKPWFVGAVIEREALSSTAMDGGVAFLHTRAREASRLARPFVIVGRSYQGIDFGAPDGKPTFLFFLLGLKYDRLHLPILGRLARTMLNPATIGKLRAQPSITKMRALLLSEDAKALRQNKQVPVVYEAVEPKLDKQMRLRTIMRLNALRKHEAKKAAEADKKAAAKAAKKKTSKKTVAKKASTKKTASAKKTATKKTATKKTATKKTTTKKATTTAKKKTATKKTVTKKTATKKTATKKTATKKTATKKKSSD